MDSSRETNKRKRSNISSSSGEESIEEESIHEELLYALVPSAMNWNGKTARKKVDDMIQFMKEQKPMKCSEAIELYYDNLFEEHWKSEGYVCRGQLVRKIDHEGLDYYYTNYTTVRMPFQAFSVRANLHCDCSDCDVSD